MTTPEQMLSEYEIAFIEKASARGNAVQMSSSTARRLLSTIASLAERDGYVKELESQLIAILPIVEEDVPIPTTEIQRRVRLGIGGQVMERFATLTAALASKEAIIRLDDGAIERLTATLAERDERIAEDTKRIASVQAANRRLQEEGARDYNGMREFQAKFIAADQENRRLQAERDELSRKLALTSR